jgi:hypothetical protein
MTQGFSIDCHGIAGDFGGRRLVDECRSIFGLH